MIYLPTIHTYSVECIGNAIITFNGTTFKNISAAAWPVSNKALFIPFSLTTPTQITKLWVANGGTVSGNFDIGIYSSDGTRLISTGSTAQSGTTQVQSVDIADKLLSAGEFYMALAFDNITGQTLRGVAVSALAASEIGVREQTSAFPLPASASLARPSATYIPVFGLLLSPRTVI